MTEELIRAGVPGLIGKAINDAEYRVAEPRRCSNLLIAKPREETEEFAESRDPEELADILEVARALAGVIGTREESVGDARHAKRERAGAFDPGSGDLPLPWEARNTS